VFLLIKGEPHCWQQGASGKPAIKKDVGDASLDEKAMQRMQDAKISLQHGVKPSIHCDTHTNWTINQSINQSINQPTNQPINYISCPWDPSGGSTDNIFNNVE